MPTFSHVLHRPTPKSDVVHRAYCDDHILEVRIEVDGFRVITPHSEHRYSDANVIRVYGMLDKVIRRSDELILEFVMEECEKAEKAEKEPA